MLCKTFELRHGGGSANENDVNQWLEELRNNGVHINILHTDVFSADAFTQLFIFYEVDHFHYQVEYAAAVLSGEVTHVRRDEWQCCPTCGAVEGAPCKPMGVADLEKLER